MHNLKKSLKKILMVVTLGIFLFASVLLVNALRFTSKQIHVEPIHPITVDETSVAPRLAQALRFQTVSHEMKGEEFLALHKYLEQIFPKAHSTLNKELVGDYSLLYTWKGRDERLRPILLMAHQDVVPVEPETLVSWEQPPFEGRIADGHIWGRGAMDDKFALLSIMEAVEMHLNEGLQPQRTIYLAFGHDEEVGGHGGAAKIAELLRERKVELEYILDEGLAITEGVLPDISKPLALIGIADKGYLSLELSVAVEGGHSSMPPTQTAIGVLSAAVSRLEERQMPASIEGVPRQTLEYIGPEMPFSKRLVMANLWLFKPLVERKLSASPSTNAGIRTTTAATIIDGGLKENVLPSSARAVVNFRPLPGDSIDRVVAHVDDVINDPRIKVNRFGDSNNEASAVSNVNAAGFEIIQRTLRQVFPEVLVAPGLCVGGTDSEHYEKLTNNIYRFSPLRLRPEDMKRLHGINERTSVKDYAESVKFYYQLITNSVQ
jgi:carboxypeptidase PM20D1